jgi:outer membrane receptor protein involved in Fe transport
VNGTWTYDEDLTNNYSLSENISAAYSSLNFKFNEKTSMITGLRYEYTNTVLSTETRHGIIDRHYGKLFPTFFLSRQLNTNNSIQFSYSRRITRPSFNELAPFIVFQSPDTYVAGNEKLQPSISDIFKSDYKYKSVLFSFTYSNENNAIRRFQPSQDPVKNVLFLRSRNLDQVTTASLMLSFPLKLTKWWNMQNNFNGLKQNVRTDYDGEKLDISLKNFSFNTINNFKIMKGLTCELSGFYRSASLWGISRSKALRSVSIGFQQKSKNEKSTFSLNLSDVFKTAIYSFSANVPELNIHNSGRLDFEPRVLRFTYSHNFGSKKVKAERKRQTGSDEERQRVD